MSRTLSNVPGSDSPLKAQLVAKAPFSNAKLTRKENHRELRHDMMNVSLVVEPDKFLELFLPQPAPPPRKKGSRAKPSNPFANVEKPATEKMMYEDYPQRLNEIIRGSGCAFVATPYKADNATDGPRLAVDCGMYPQDRMPTQDLTKGMDAATKKDFRRVCWSGIDLPAECKLEDDPFDDNVDTGRPHNEKRKDASGQALSYIELIYHHQHRTFTFMLVFIGLNCRLLRVDRSGLFVTKRFDITKTDFLVEFLRRYVRLSPEARGFDTTAEYIDPLEDKLAGMMKERLAEVEQALEEQKALEAKGANVDGEGEDRVEEHVVKLWRDALDEKWPWWKLRVPDEVTKKDRWFLVGKPSFQAPGVRGRGTRCYIAIELFERGRNKRVLDTKFVHLKDCWRVVSDNTSDQAMDIRKEGDTLEKLNGAKVERVSTLVAHGDIHDQNTSASLKAWKMVNDKFKCRLKTHQHYRLVVEEIGKPLSEFRSSTELVVALYDCIQAHYQAMNIKIIHRDISGGNILLYRKKGEKAWRGLLTDWELSKDSEVFPVARQAGRTGTLQFSAVRVLNDPSRPIVVADELECFFHVLIYYAVRFLRHNLPDKFVGMFLNNYFDASSGQTQKGELTAPALKRLSMEIGEISLEDFGVASTLKFIWVDDEPTQVTHQTTGTTPPDPDFGHPLNTLIDTLLSWFSALYTVEKQRKRTSGSAPGPSQPRQGGELPVIGMNRRTGNTTSAVGDGRAEPSDEELAKLQHLAEKLDSQSNVLELIQEICSQPFPRKDKGRDKRPEKGYSPCSPETPQFSEVSSFSNPQVELDGSDEEVEDGDGSTAVPNAPAPAAFAKLAARIDEGDATRRAAMAPRTPSPCPSRPKRGRENDTKRETLGKRSRY